MSNRFDWSTVSKDDHRTLLTLIGNDGHSIYPPKYLLEHGINPLIVAHFCTTQKSGSYWKDQISINDLPVDEMEGAYGLTVLWSLADHYKVSSLAMGRGFQAQELTEKLEKKLNKSSL